MPESEVFEVEIKVSRPGQQDAFVRREYTSRDSLSTDGAARELAQGFTAETDRRLRPVNDGR